MRSALIARAAAVALAAGAASAQTATPDLWNGAEAGMSIDRVATLFPQANPETGQTREDGSQAGLSIPAQLAGSPAEAVFFFHNRNLSAVIVESQSVQPDRSRENLAETRRIIALATSQYGRPRRCIDRPELAALTCDWVVGGMKVAVSYRDVAGRDPGLSVLYGLAD